MRHRSCGVLDKSNLLVNAAPCWAWLAILITWTDLPCSTPIFKTNGKDSTYPLLACILHTAALNTDPDSSPPEVKPRPMKTIYKGQKCSSPMVSTIEGGFHCTHKRKSLHTTTYASLAEKSLLFVANCTLWDLHHILIVSLIQDHLNYSSLIFAEET